MAKLVVEIDLPGVERRGMNDLDWFPEEENGKIIVYEAYLSRSIVDDSFFSFTLLRIED